MFYLVQCLVMVDFWQWREYILGHDIWGELATIYQIKTGLKAVFRS